MSLKIELDCPFICQVLLCAVQEAAGSGCGDGIRLRPFYHKKDLKISSDCPFIRFYCALYKKLLDLTMAFDLSHYKNICKSLQTVPLSGSTALCTRSCWTRVWRRPPPARWCSSTLSSTPWTRIRPSTGSRPSSSGYSRYSIFTSPFPLCNVELIKKISSLPVLTFF